jgi:hypothetical protein
MALPYVAPIALLALKATAVNNGLAKTPQMGWVRAGIQFTYLIEADLTASEQLEHIRLRRFRRPAPRDITAIDRLRAPRPRLQLRCSR